MRERKANRLKNYDYSKNGMYFITIVVKNREDIFGEIKDSEMILNEYGEIAKKCFEEIEEHYEECNIDEVCIMPNHIHGIIVIYKTEEGNRHASSLHRRNNERLPSVIGGFKSAVTKYVNMKEKIYFQWQKSYYDRIIRNEDELNKTRDYIINNPKNWINDNENKINCR